MTINKKKLFLISVLLVGMLFLAILPLTTRALTEDAQKNIYVSSEEVIEDNFIQAGRVIDFNGQAQKDVIVAGGNINITGPVKGDVIVFGGNIKINGDVAGNIRAFGGTIEINSKVGKNVSAFGGIVIISKDAEIGWDVLAGAGNLEIRGKVAGNVIGGAGNVILANEIGGNVNLFGSKESQLTLYPQADIKGNLTYSASQEAEIKEGAKIAGETSYKPVSLPVIGTARAERVLLASYFLGKIISFLSLLLIGLLIITLIPKKSEEIGKKMLDKPWANIGWGLIYLIITPIVLILVAVTVIGIPLALIVLFSYLIAIYLTKIFIGIALGQKLLKWGNNKQKVSLTWAMILGVILFYILVDLPFIGWIIWLLGTCWALGAIVEAKKQTLKQIER